MCCMVPLNVYIFVMQTTMQKKVIFLKKFYIKCNTGNLETSLKQKKLKTENNKNKAMKTNLNKSLRRRNLQKAALRTAAVIVSFVLISFTVAAQGFWKQLLTNNGISEIAMVLADQPAEAIVYETKSTEKGIYSGSNSQSYFFEEVYEGSLELENWMLDDLFFELSFRQETITEESPVELEQWMLDDGYFNNLQEEKPLNLEGWMTDENHWNI